MSVELNIIEILESMRNNHSVKLVSWNRSLFQRYIIYRLDGNPDPLKDEDSLRAFTKWMEELDLMGRILKPNKEKISEICVNPCNLRVGLGAEQILRRK